MKHTIITTVIAAVAMFAAAPAADAQRYHQHHGYHHGQHHGHHHSQQSRYIFISGHHACGTPIYTERYVIRFDRYRRPVYGYRVVRHRPHYHVRPAPRGYRHHHVAPTCPPPRHHYQRTRSGGYINIRF